MSSEKYNIGRPNGGKPLNIGVDAKSGEYLVTVEGLAAGGRGVGRAEGRVWFVRGGFPGDRVWARQGRSVRADWRRAPGSRGIEVGARGAEG